MTHISIFDVIIICLYILLVAGYGLWKARKVKGSEDFLVAGRSLGLFVLIGTLVMTEFNTAAMIGYSAYGYQGGLFATLVALCFVFGLGPYTFIVAKRWNRLKAISVAELFEQRYDKNLRIFAGLLIMSTLLLFSTAYLRAASLVFSEALNLNFIWTVVVISGIVLIFTLAGGMMSVAFTNMLSFIVTLVALPTMFFIAQKRALDLGGMATVFEERYLSFDLRGMWDDPIIPFELIFTIYMLVFLIYMLAPWYGQIMFSTKDEKTAYRGVFIATVVVTLVYWLSIQTAAYARVGFPDLHDPQLAIPKVISRWMPIGIKGLSLALIFSICQTTMATIWNNSVSIIAQDVYKNYINPAASEKRLLFFSRTLTLVIAIFTILVSIFFVDMVIQVLFFANIALVSLFFPGVGGFLWWKLGRRAAWTTTILGLVFGWTIFILKKFANASLPVWLQNHDWLFIYCCFLAPIAILIGIVLVFLEKSDMTFIAKKVSFYNKVGAPWFGKKQYVQYKSMLH